jgi:hypothetical protein
MTVTLNPVRREGGVWGEIFCSKPHPTRPDVWCRRQPHHSGDCAAFTFKISQPEHWPAPAASNATRCPTTCR